VEDQQHLPKLLAEIKKLQHAIKDVLHHHHLQHQLIHVIAKRLQLQNVEDQQHLPKLDAEMTKLQLALRDVLHHHHLLQLQ
jgi:glutamate-1-semialdehyde aminotransferase